MTSATTKAVRGLARALSDAGLGGCELCFASKNVAPRWSFDGARLCRDCIPGPDTAVAFVLEVFDLSHAEAAETLGIGRLSVLRAANGRPVRRKAAEALSKLTGISVRDLMRGPGGDMSVLGGRK